MKAPYIHSNEGLMDVLLPIVLALLAATSTVWAAPDEPAPLDPIERIETVRPEPPAVIAPPVLDPDPTDFVGDWVSVDPDTVLTTGLVINHPDAFTVERYSYCPPEDGGRVIILEADEEERPLSPPRGECSEGGVVAMSSRHTVVAVFLEDLSTITHTLTLLQDGVLHSRTEFDFLLRSESLVVEEYFERAWDPDDLLGEWVNIDPETRGITRLEIHRDAGLAVHSYGACGGGECDQGSTPLSVRRGGLMAVRDFSFKRELLFLSPLRDALLAISFNEFPGDETRNYSARYAFVRSPESRPVFRRGDVDSDGAVSVTDGMLLLNHLFKGGEAPGCLDAADADDDGALDLTDPLRILQHLFLGGEPPPEPFGECGEDPTLDELSCEGPPVCS